MRVWFCNRRQKETLMTPPTGQLDGTPTSAMMMSPPPDDAMHSGGSPPLSMTHGHLSHHHPHHQQQQQQARNFNNIFDIPINGGTGGGIAPGAEWILDANLLRTRQRVYSVGIALFLMMIKVRLIFLFEIQ